MSKLQVKPQVGYTKSQSSTNPAMYPNTTVESIYWEKEHMTLEEALRNGGGGSSDVQTEMPEDGFAPNTFYNLGTITENMTFLMAEGEEGKANHYFWVFETGDDVPEITWPEGIRLWKDNKAPVIAANQHYEISVYDGVALYIAIEMTVPMLSIPLTFEILGDGNILWKHESTAQTIEYSKNGGEWTSITATTDGSEIPVVTGDNLRFRGTAWPGSDSCYFNSTCEFSVKGNPSSLKYGDVLTGNEALEESCLLNMFYGCTGLTSAENLALPATTLAEGCYSCMFYECTNLATVPELPATTLAENCYENMFYGCTSLTSAPALPATTLAGACYGGMFYGCEALTTAPDLPATTLAFGCYYEMFYGCNLLNSVKCIATEMAGESTSNWLSGVADSGTFTKKAGVEWPTGASGIPSGWTVIEES